MTSPENTARTGTGRVALVTGGTRGLGRALARRLLADSWHVVVDGRDATALAAAAQQLGGDGRLTALPGDVADPGHRDDLAAAVRQLDRLDLLVNNASVLGPTPLPPLTATPPAELLRVLAVNAVAPQALVRLLAPELRRSAGRVVNVSSDAAVEAYPGWGGYGSAKAALDHLSAVLAVEEPGIRVYAVDPGDMATEMHALAVPDADLASLPDPDSVVPALLRLVHEDLPSGRYRASELAGDLRAGRVPA